MNLSLRCIIGNDDDSRDTAFEYPHSHRSSDAYGCPVIVITSDQGTRPGSVQGALICVTDR